MNKAKESEFAFRGEGKESFKERLRELIGHRSVRSAAKSWGLSFSTLNNYLNRETDPSLSAAKAIANAEGVSLDWLASGAGCKKMNSIESGESHHVDDFNPNDKLSVAWQMVLESIEPEDAYALIKLIHRKGIEKVIGGVVADGTSPRLSELELALVVLPTEEKERLMALHEAKKGASQEHQIDESENLPSENKKAG